MRQYALRLDGAQRRTERAEQPEGGSSIVQPHQLRWTDNAEFESGFTIQRTAFQHSMVIWRQATDNGTGSLSQTHSFSLPLLPASGQIRSTMPSWFDAKAYEPSRLSFLGDLAGVHAYRDSMMEPSYAPSAFDPSCMDHAAPSHLST